MCFLLLPLLRIYQLSGNQAFVLFYWKYILHFYPNLFKKTNPQNKKGSYMSVMQM